MEDNRARISDLANNVATGGHRMINLLRATVAGDVRYTMRPPR